MGDTILFRFEEHRQNYTKSNSQNFAKTFDNKKKDRGIYELLCRRYIEASGIEEITTKIESIKPKKLKDYLDELSQTDIQQNFDDKFDELKDFIENNVNEDIVLEIEHGTAVSFENLENFAKDEVERKKFLIRVFELLKIIHANGIVHRDIKPENLIYVYRHNSPVPVLVLNDWDVSFILGNNEHNGRQKVVPLAGVATLAYAAPEQLNNNFGAVSRKTDIWQAGMIAYRLYNNNNFPNNYGNIENLTANKLKNIFLELGQSNRAFDYPQNGERKIKKCIINMLSIRSDIRPEASNVLKTIRDGNQPTPAPVPAPDPDPKLTFEQILAICCVVAVVIVASKLIGNKKSEQPTQSAPPPIVSNNYEEKTTEQTEHIEETTNKIPEQTKSQTVYDEIDVPLKYYEHERVDIGYYTGYVDKNNQPHGEGCIEYDDGSKYEGAFFNGEFHGEGTFTATDGTSYKGNWDMGELCDENAEIHYSNDNTYLGGYSNGKYNGRGTYILKTAERGYQGTYSGTFVDGNFEGQGFFEYEDKTTFLGIFQNHEQWEGDMTYPNGYIRRIENGKYKD